MLARWRWLEDAGKKNLERADMNNLSLDLRNHSWAGQSSVSDSQFNTRNKLNQLLAEPLYIMRWNLNYFVNRAHALTNEIYNLGSTDRNQPGVSMLATS